MLSKSVIQFSVDGRGCVPSLLFDLRPNYGGGNEDNGDLLQKVPCMWSQACSATLSAPDPVAEYHQPTPPPETPGHSQASLGQSPLGSLLLSPGSWYTHVSVSALQESVSPVLSKFWQLYGGVNGDLLQEGLYHTQVYCTQSPSPCSSPLLTRTSAGDIQTQFCLSLCGCLGPGALKVCLSPQRVSDGYGV